MFSLGQKFGKGSAGQFWMEVCPAVPVKQWLDLEEWGEGEAGGWLGISPSSFGLSEYTSLSFLTAWWT